MSEDASGVSSRMTSYLAANPLKEGIDTKSSGIIGLIEDSLGAVITAVLIAIFLLYTVMVIQFERFSCCSRRMRSSSFLPCSSAMHGLCCHCWMRCGRIS